MTGQKRSAKTKVYSAAAMVTEESENETALQAQDDLTQEGDEDAALINDFECTAAELIQDDPELASAYSAYVEARKRLSEKHRNRGLLANWSWRLVQLERERDSPQRGLQW